MNDVSPPKPKKTADAEFYSSLASKQRLPQYNTNSVTAEKRTLSEEEATILYETTQPVQN